MKKKNLARILSVILAACLVLVGCGSSSTDSSDTTSESAAEEVTVDEEADDTEEVDAEEADAAEGEAITDLTMWMTVANEFDTIVMQHNEGNVNSVGANIVSPLLELNAGGELQPAVAYEWGTDDNGVTWTFKLRDDVVWVDVNGNYLADCTSADWVTSMEWILNFWKNDSYNTSMPISTIKGAEDYYEYTKAMDEEEAKALDTTTFLEMVGLEAPDDYTLIYTCFKEVPYFDTLCTNSSMYPIPQGMIDAVGVDGIVGISNEDFWYSGPYILTTFVLNNEKVLTKNDSYWDKDCSLFDSVTIKMIEDDLMDDTLWMSGEVDYTLLDNSTLNAIMEDPDSEWYQYLCKTPISGTPQVMFYNFSKNNEDGTPDDNWNKAIANDAFRQSIYWGLDWTDVWYMVDPMDPLDLENLCYVAPNMSSFSDGRDYTTRVIELLDMPESDGTHGRRYVPDLAESYKEQAIEELTAEGVTFPVEMDYYIKAGSSTALDQANVYKETFEALGTDYIQFNIKTYVSSASEEVYTPSLQSICASGWGADFGDISNFIDQCLFDNESAVFGVRMGLTSTVDDHVAELWEEFTELAVEAGNISVMDDRLEAYAQAESYMLNNALILPYRYDVSWQLTKINDYSRKQSSWGIGNNVYKNWETSTTPYTTEQYAEFKDEWDEKYGG